MAESTIITGQFVRINQVPASIGERILARLIDYIILIIYLFASFYLFNELGLFRQMRDLSLVIFLLAVYLPAFCYSFLWEVYNNGQSPGKRIVNIRVVKADGTTPTLSSYFLRWLLFGIDFIMTGGLGLIVAIVSKNNQRLGDLAAGTIVIKEKNYKKIQVSLDEFDYLSENYRPVFPQAQDLSLEQVNVISRTLDMSRGKDRSRHIQQLADKIRGMLSIRPGHEGDEALLNTLVRDYQYYAMEVV